MSIVGRSSALRLDLHPENQSYLGLKCSSGWIGKREWSPGHPRPEVAEFSR